MHEHTKQQSLRVYRDVALTAIHPLSSVVAARAAAFRGLYALGVDDRGHRLGSRPAPSRSITTR